MQPEAWMCTAWHCRMAAVLAVRCTCMSTHAPTHTHADGAYCTQTRCIILGRLLASFMACAVQVTDRWSSSELLQAGVPKFLLEEVYSALGKVSWWTGRSEAVQGGSLAI